MNFEINKLYKANNKEIVRIICTNKESIYGTRMLGLTLTKPNILREYTPYGKCTDFVGEQCDLIEECKEPTTITEYLIDDQHGIFSTVWLKDISQMHDYLLKYPRIRILKPLRTTTLEPQE